MAFIVEDGTIVEDANSYASVEYADAYFATRGNETWTNFDPEAKEQYLVLASDYIGLRWGEILKGELVEDAQPLLFPRLWNNVSTYPMVLLKAVSEYALRAGMAGGMLFPNVAYDETGRLATKKVEEVGPIREETSWAASGSMSQPAQYIPYPLPDGLMKTLLKPGLGRHVVRA